MSRYVVTTSIPYVNGRPHVGHSLELVQADVLARWHRQRGDEVRAQTGTDDNALKNVRSAEEAGVPVAEYVAGVAQRFVALGDALELSFDDFVQTSSDPRHRAAVTKLWAATDDFYRKSYSGLYCVGCEQYYPEDELVDGRCPEHDTVPELVEEENWFFRLSRYQDRLVELISSGALRIEPAVRRREVLSFIEGGLADFSVSRTVSRARGWGIPVPGDPEQVIYVWYDALANYLSGPGYGTDERSFAHWWRDSDERVHVIGKGIIRFHAVYWPAMLLSAGLPLPTSIFVHEYLTSGGQKISKSVGNAEDPADIVARFGADALRWWLLADVARTGDTDYTAERLVAKVNEDLANNIGNLVNRTVSMVAKYRDGVVPVVASDNPAADELRRARFEVSGTVSDALGAFDFRRATEAITRIGDEGNRYVQATKPWLLAKNGSHDELDAVLAELVATCRDLAWQLEAFLPAAALRIVEQLGDERVAEPRPVFPRLEVSPSRDPRRRSAPPNTAR